jgi:NADPH-dependent 2,4-dienoyl-CoA reductase/sulfur reductase-like enzyme
MIAPRRTDVVVVGAGPAGLAAADAAASMGRTVLLIDQGAHPGGQIWRHRSGDALPGRGRRLIDAARPPRVSVAQRASVVDAPSANELVVDFNGRLALVDTTALVLATGASERFLPFPGWTLPGVVGVGGMQALCKGGLPVAGMRVVLAGSGPLLLPVAATLRAAGAAVSVIAEQAPRAAVRRFASRALRDPARLWQAIALRAGTLGIPYRTDTWVVRAEGDDRVRWVTLSFAGEPRVEPCDWLATSAGLVPRTELAELLGCSLAPDGIVVDGEQRTSLAGVWAAGECCGVKGDAAAIVEGRMAGLAAAGGEIPEPLGRRRDRGRAFGALMAAAFAPRTELVERLTPATIICRCEDVRCRDLDPAWGQRQAKLWSRIGMGACQGAVCGPACESLFGWQRNAARPPLEQPPVDGWARALDRVTPPDRGVASSPGPSDA